MTALEPSLRAAGFSLRGLTQALAPSETVAPRGLKPAARIVAELMTRGTGTGSTRVSVASMTTTGLHAWLNEDIVCPEQVG